MTWEPPFDPRCCERCGAVRAYWPPGLDCCSLLGTYRGRHRKPKRAPDPVADEAAEIGWPA